MLLNKSFTKLSFCLLLIFKNPHGFEEKKNKSLKNKVYNETTHAGPMGMGLTKSYEINNQKICIYNTVNGQEQVTLKFINKCPLKPPLTKIYK